MKLRVGLGHLKPSVLSFDIKYYGFLQREPSMTDFKQFNYYHKLYVILFSGAALGTMVCDASSQGVWLDLELGLQPVWSLTRSVLALSPALPG